MGEASKIAWTHSTFNPWIGCTKVGPGCDHCYAENQDSRKRWGGVVHWGAGVPRHLTSESNWNQPLRWNAKAEKSGQPHRVFCASLADVFDNEVPQGWRDELVDLIVATPALTWLLLTKRIGNVQKMLPDWTFKNVWIGATIVNQEEWDRDHDKLLAVKNVPVRFVSYEPAISLVHFSNAMPDWIIVGGESGHKAREFNINWARDVIGQCDDRGAACFVKQLGAKPTIAGCPLPLKDRAGADPSEWPEDLRVREFPRGA